ncbi:sugar phosphate transporter domain-containing protein [Artemisia annua]|uniref:Sugar phosphate transporter domain-containing protein n=1 Tax=Artemisia annua TaxID=35608 RepID=A0A2U1KDC5_ARTAN|nr:sugar phosphate transporter domain-containing protein [Artemisia annua]
MKSKDQKTLLVSESGDDNDRRHAPVSSPMTKKGVYAAISYMTCAGQGVEDLR